MAQMNVEIIMQRRMAIPGLMAEIGRHRAENGESIGYYSGL